MIWSKAIKDTSSLKLSDEKIEIHGNILTELKPRFIQPGDKKTAKKDLQATE